MAFRLTTIHPRRVKRLSRLKRADFVEPGCDMNGLKLLIAD